MEKRQRKFWRERLSARDQRVRHAKWCEILTGFMWLRKKRTVGVLRTERTFGVTNCWNIERLNDI